MTEPRVSRLRIAVVVMGVSGSGKSTVAAGIARALGLHFIDGDDLHSPESVAKMKAGKPLQDEDRRPWLGRVGACLADAAQWPQGVAVACSALKRVYRDLIRGVAPGVRFVFLDGSTELIAARMAERSDHFMPGAMLASQLRTLERPGPDEADVHRVGIEVASEQVVKRAMSALQRESSPSPDALPRPP